MSRAELGIRWSVIVAAVAAASVAAPTAVQAPLGIISLISTAQLLARLTHRRDPVECWLVGSVGTVVLLILSGLLVNYAPHGLTTTNWNLAWALISGVVLIGVAHTGPQLAFGFSRAAAAAFAILGAATVGAYALADAGVSRQNAQPVLAFSALSYGTNHEATLLIQSTNAGGSFQLSVLPDDANRGATSEDVRLPTRGVSRARVVVQLPRARSRWVLVLRSTSGSRATTRKLILAKATNIG